MFLVFDTVISYTYVFMTCSIFYCLYDTLMDPWNVCIYYIGMYVFVCMYVYICERTETDLVLASVVTVRNVWNIKLD
jgi:hypothetical protein